VNSVPITDDLQQAAPDVTERASTILIVDDEPIGRETLRAMLLTQGYNLATARSGTEALAKAVELTPDLIFLDVMMPEMDGFEVCRCLRADPVLAEVPIIMVTALDDRDSRLQGIEAGADDFVSKPFDRVELRTRVKTIMRLNRYQRLLLERDYRQMAEEHIRQRNRELTLLNRVIAAAATALDAQEVINIACESLVHTFAVCRATALLLDTTQTHWTVVARSAAAAAPHPCGSCLEQIQNGAADTDMRLPMAHVLQTKMPLSITRPASDAVLSPDAPLAPMYALMERSGLATCLIVPILMRNQVVGLIEMGAVEPCSFNDQELLLAQSVASAVGQAMETAQLYQQLQRHADNLEEVVAQRTHELELERDRTQAILEALGEAVLVTDFEDIVHYFNPAAAALTGYSSDEVVGQHAYSRPGDGPLPAISEEIQQIVQAGQTWRGELVNQRKDGTRYDAAVTIAPLFDPHTPGQPVGYVSVQRDITPIKEAERLKDQFVSNVSHELRTPLSIITLLSGNLDTLYARLSDERRQRMIRDIREHTRVLDDLISDLLEIARIDSQRISMKRQPLNLVELIGEEADKQVPLIQKKAQSLSVTGVDYLPVSGNDGQLRQILRNLLNNAIKYTPDRGCITCECRMLTAGEAEEPVWPGSHALPPGMWAAVRVTDTGIGISEENMPQIFERFYRVQPQGNISGTGLGLAIAHELITLHAGTIAVASTPGEGSTFVVYFPLLTEEVRTHEQIYSCC
jgi:PAS domain S-box-containing protein